MWLLILTLLFGTTIGSCPPGSYFLAHSHKCITVDAEGTKYGYFQAEVACHRRGGHLVSISSLLDNAIMFALAKGETLNETAFIGAISKDGVWQWNTGDAVHFTNWAAGQPNDGEDCAVMSLTDSLWYSICPPKWEMFKDSCYLYHEENVQNVTWNDAMRECRNRGGNLASIHSVEENNFLKGLLPTEACTRRATAWIGFHSPSSNADVRWSDENKVTCNNAPPGYNSYHWQPRVYYITGDCEDNDENEHTGGGEWQFGNDWDTRSAYVCKRAPILECHGGRVPSA